MDKLAKLQTLFLLLLTLLQAALLVEIQAVREQIRVLARGPVQARVQVPAQEPVRVQEPALAPAPAPAQIVDFREQLLQEQRALQTVQTVR